MPWWALVGIAPMLAVLIYLVWEMASYEEPLHDDMGDEPSRASWTSSAMQNDMQGDG